MIYILINISRYSFEYRDFLVYLQAEILNYQDMTQLVITLKDQSYLPNIRRIVKSLEGVEKVSTKSTIPVKRKKFLDEFRHAVAQTKDFKEGKTSFGTWEDMMNEL